MALNEGTTANKSLTHLLPFIGDSNESDEDDPFLWSKYSNSDPRRLSGKAYLSKLKASIISQGKQLDMSDEEIISYLEAPCFLCGRKHIPGDNPVNSIDRLESGYGQYSADLCCTLCQDCNCLKLWLYPAEFVRKVLLWHANREHILKYIPTIEDVVRQGQ